MKAKLLLIFTFFIVSSASVYSQTPVSTPTSSATSTPNQSKKETFSISKFAEDLEAIDKSLTSIAFSLAKVMVVALSLLVLYRLVLLIVYRSSQLVIDNVSNASGADELEKVLPSLSQLARERLVREMKGVRQRVKEHIKTVGPETYRPPNKLPLPQVTPDQRLADLVASLNELTPDQIDPVVQLLKVIFPPFGTKVTSILQSQGQEHSKLGITFEITNIEGRLSSKLYTIWEPTDDKTADTKNDSSQMLKDRYRQLLRPAARWLAIELCRREMVDAVPWTYFGNRRKKYQAQINNFFGVLNFASVPTHGKFFYQLAIEDLQQAIDLYPDWYQPYENLADIYSTQGREFQGKEGVNLQRQAILQYEEALQRCQDEAIKRRIRVGKAMAQLVTGNDTFIQEAKQEIQNVEKNWDATEELNTQFLYNLASWYAIALTQGFSDASAEKTARLYLAYALVRNSDSDLWYWASKDPDLKGINEGFAELQFTLLKKLNEVPQLPKLKNQDFAKPIQEVLQEVNWL